MIAIEAMMQNIITESAVVVKFIGFEEIMLWFVSQLLDTIRFVIPSSFASSYNALSDVHLEELDVDEEDKSKGLRMTYRMCK